MTQADKRKQVEMIISGLLNDADNDFVKSVVGMINKRYGEKKPRKRKPMTDEQRHKWNEYNRNYRKAHPEKVRNWQDNYIIRKAEKLKAEQEGKA